MSAQSAASGVVSATGSSLIVSPEPVWPQSTRRSRGHPSAVVCQARIPRLRDIRR